MADNLGFGGSTNPYLGKNNPYLQGQIDSALADTTRAYNMTTAPSTASAMVRSGSFGNSGLEQMQGEQQRQLTQTLGNQANNFRAGDYQNQQNMYKWDQEFGRSLYNDAYGQNMNNLQVGMGLIGMGNQYSQQDLANSTNIQNTPLNYYSQFANQSNQFGNAGGATSTTAQGQGSPLTGALGGWQLGSSIGKNLGFGGGVSMGQIAQGGWGTGNSYGNQDLGQYL